MNYAKEIQSIAKKNISKGYDVGDHKLFGFSVEVSSINGREYELETIVQVDVAYDGETPVIYLLPYYWTNKENGWCDHDDIFFYDLNDADKIKIYKAFKEFVEDKPTDNMAKTDTNLSAYVKAKTLEEKVKLIDAWEEDRGSDGEFVYDLDNDEDALNWVSLYGAKFLYQCRVEGRWWMGGWQFVKPCEEGNTKCFCLTNEECNKMLTDENIIGEIADRYEGYLKDNDKSLNTIKWVEEIYGGLIDFQGYARAKGDILPYCQYAWITRSHDGSYEDASVGFMTKEECYKSMRNAVLEKMKWNTEFADVCEGEGGEDSFDTIGYEVHFSPNFIEHKSYSGNYIALIVRCNSEGDLEPNAWNRLDEMLKTSVEIGMF